MTPPSIRLVVFDWAGTAVDHGSCAPVAPFVAAFARHGVAVSPAEARGPMGLHKRDHVRELFRLPAVAARWAAAHGRDWAEDDVEAVYQAFAPLQLEVLAGHAEPIPGVPAAVAELRRRGVAVGGTTGYFRAAAERVAEAARRWGYAPAAVVKVGDTAPDVGEGRNAGAWSVGVTHTGSDVGCTAAEFAALPERDRADRVAAAGRRLLAAGAHALIPSAADVPALVDELNVRLRRGERP